MWLRGGNQMKGKKAVSAVIGVILMVAITVAIAATVYVYVESLREDEAEEPNPVEEDWCEDCGGNYEVRMENGTSVGYCVFPNETECNALDLYNSGNCTCPE